MCMQAVRIILYWTLNYYPFASFDHALVDYLIKFKKKIIIFLPKLWPFENLANMLQV